MRLSCLETEGGVDAGLQGRPSLFPTPSMTAAPTAYSPASPTQLLRATYAARIAAWVRRTKPQGEPAKGTRALLALARALRLPQEWDRVIEVQKSLGGENISPAPLLMNRVEIEAYSQDSNAWVIKTPGRKVPALVLQGDSFCALFTTAQSLVERARACGCGDPELLGEAEELRDVLWHQLHHYEDTLRAAGLPLPYNRVAAPL